MSRENFLHFFRWHTPDVANDWGSLGISGNNPCVTEGITDSCAIGHRAMLVDDNFSAFDRAAGGG
jgi:hypothetical protein